MDFRHIILLCGVIDTASTIEVPRSWTQLLHYTTTTTLDLLVPVFLGSLWTSCLHLFTTASQDTYNHVRRRNGFTTCVCFRPVGHVNLCSQFFLHQISHDWTRGTRLGEASNPGPPCLSNPCRPLSVSLLNPTTIYQKEDDLLALDSDVLCLAETAATCTVQRAFDQALRTTVFRTFWSAPVPDKITKTGPTLGQPLRGDNL